MTLPERLYARPADIHPSRRVPQHATQECVPTPMTALTTRIRRCETSPHFAPETARCPRAVAPASHTLAGHLALIEIP